MILSYVEFHHSDSWNWKRSENGKNRLENHLLRSSYGSLVTSCGHNSEIPFCSGARLALTVSWWKRQTRWSIPTSFYRFYHFSNFWSNFFKNSFYVRFNSVTNDFFTFFQYFFCIIRQNAKSVKRLREFHKFFSAENLVCQSNFWVIFSDFTRDSRKNQEKM